MYCPHSHLHVHHHNHNNHHHFLNGQPSPSSSSSSAAEIATPGQDVFVVVDQYAPIIYSTPSSLLHYLWSSMSSSSSSSSSSPSNYLHHHNHIGIHSHHHHDNHHTLFDSFNSLHPIIWSTANNLVLKLKSNELNIEQQSPQSSMISSPTSMLMNVTSLYENSELMNDSIISTVESISSESSSTDILLFGSILTLDTILTLILPYSIIFILSIVGNLLVIITLTLDRTMRSVTNIFLLNLAISDLLLGVFCMPFTLVGVLLRRFIFGTFMCHLISYFQAVSVAVSVWTLVSMSIERYYAICHPFRSRESRQNKKHAYRILAIIWTLAFITMSPTAIVSKLQQTNQTGHYKCREAWPSFFHKQVFTLFLDFVLLIIPLIIMILTYSSIALTLRNNVQRHQDTINGSNSNHNKQLTTITTTTTTKKTSNFFRYKTTSFSNNDKTKNNGNQVNKRNVSSSGEDRSNYLLLPSTASQQQTKTFLEVDKHHHHHSYNALTSSSSSLHHDSFRSQIISSPSSFNDDGTQKRDLKNGLNSSSLLQPSTSSSLSTPRTILRVSSHHSGHQFRQRRIITMLFVVVIEFFICWSPIFILDTMALYRPAMVYGTSKKVSRWIRIDIISVCHLLCFCSSCTNPITYCFMNKRFRDHFFSLFRCRTMPSSMTTTNQHSHCMNQSIGPPSQNEIK